MCRVDRYTSRPVAKDCLPVCLFTCLPTLIRKHLLILTAYTLLALGMSWPLALNFATALPGVEGDAGSFVWALGWMKTALVDLRVNPFQSDYVFYPLGGATQLLWAVSLIAFISIPLQFLFGLIATYNVLYLAATVVTAWGTCLLAEEILSKSTVNGQRSTVQWNPLPPFQTFLLFKFITLHATRLTRPSRLAPLVAGLVFAFAPLRLGYGLSFFNLFNTQLIPLYALFLIRALRDHSRRNAVTAGILLGLNAYIDFQIAAFLVLFTGLYAAYQAIELAVTAAPSQPASARPGSVGGGKLAVVAAVSTAAMIALVSLAVVAPLLGMLAKDFAAEGGNYIRVFPISYSAERSYDLLSFCVPNARSTFFPGTPLKIAGVNAPAKPGDESARSPDHQAFVGYLALALAAYATVRQWKRARFWFFAATLFGLFALGPSLHIFGRDLNIPLPYLALHEIPIVNHIRIPMRYGILVMLALAILAALAIYDLQKRITHHASRIPLYVLRFALFLLPFLILLEYAALPYPIQRVDIPRVYSDLARVPGDFTVLEIPTFNWRFAALTEMYQAIHGKRILRAYTNRIAPGVAEYFGTRGIPIVVRSLRVLEGAEKGELTADEIAEDKWARDEVVRFYDLRYAVVHPDLLKPAEATAIDAYLRDVLKAHVISDQGTAVAYAIPRAAAASDKVWIDLRENIGQMYAGRGWQFEYPQANWQGKFNYVWTRGAQSEIYFVADRAMARVMKFNARAESPQRVTVWLNDTRVGEITLTDVWQDRHVDLPAHALQAGMNRVRLEYGTALEETIGVTTITIE